MSEMMRAHFESIQRAERPTVREIADTTQTARKVHACDACRGSITPGQRYRRIVLVVDDEVSVEKFHATPCWR
jgi:hypothetical protein